VSEASGTQFSTEAARDEAGEANSVMDWAEMKPGFTVADIGAGEGYYTIRLAKRVGEKGRVLAQDINAGALQRLGERVARDRLDNVAIKPGAIDDPRLPENSFDRIFLVHMYHEVSEPYAFLWRLRPALIKGGQVIVVDRDRPTDSHGIPPKLLFCEFEATGYRLTGFAERPEVKGYFARFEATGKKTKKRPLTAGGRAVKGHVAILLPVGVRGAGRLRTQTQTQTQTFQTRQLTGQPIHRTADQHMPVCFNTAYLGQFPPGQNSALGAPIWRYAPQFGVNSMPKADPPFLTAAANGGDHDHAACHHWRVATKQLSCRNHNQSAKS
jgi:SAM-dependent methyltransferase